MVGRISRVTAFLVLAVLASTPAMGQVQPQVTLASGKAPVYDVAWSPDGKLLATCSFDGKVALWDAATGRLLKTYEGHRGLVLGVAFSPNGRYLASVGQDRTLKLWELPNAAPVRTLSGHGGPVLSLAVTTDGKVLATASADGNVKLWDVGGGKETANLQVGSPVHSVRFSPNAAIVVAGGDDRVLRIWNRGDGKLQASAEGHLDAILATAVHANNQQVLTAGRDGQIKLWLLPIPAPRQIGGHGAAVLALALSPDGARVLSGGADNSVRLHLVGNGNQERTFSGFSERVTAVAYSTDGQSVAAGSLAGVVRIYNARNGQPLGLLGAHTAQITGVSFHAGGQLILTTSLDGSAKLWKLPVPQAKTTALAAEPVQLVDMVGRPQLVALLKNGAAVVLDRASGNPQRSIKAADGALVAAAPVPGQPILFVAAANNRVARCNVDNGKVEYDFAVGEVAPTTLATAPDGSRIAVGLANGHVLIFPGSKPEGDGKISALKDIQAHQGAVRSVAFTPDGARIVTSGADGAVRLWKGEDGAKIAELSSSGGAIIHLQPVDNGATLIAITETGLVLRLAGADLKEGGRLQPVQQKIVAAAVSSDGSRVALTAESGRTYLVDLSSGKVLQWYDQGGAVGVSFGADQNTAVVATKDKKLHLLPLALDTVIYSGDAPATAGILLTNGRAAVALASGEVILWDPIDKKELARLPGHKGGTSAISATKDSKRLVTGGADGVVRVWDVRQAKELLAIQGAHEKPIMGVSFSADESRVASTDASGVTRVWDIGGSSPVLLQTYRASTPTHGVAFLPDNKSVLVAAEDKNIYVYAIGVGQRYVGHKGAVRAIAFHPSGTQFVSGGDDAVVRLWKTADGSLQGEWTGHSGPINSLAYSPNGAMVASGAEDRSVRVWNAASGDQITAWSDHDGKVTAVAFSFDNKLVAAATDAGQVTIWSLADNAAVQRFRAPAAVHEVSFLPDNRTILAACDNNVVVQFALAGDTPRNLTGHGDIVDAVTFSPDGRLVVTGAYDKTVRLWDPDAGKQVRSIAADTQRAVYTVAFTPDGKTLIAAGSDSIIKAFKTENGQELRRFTGHSDGVFGIAVSSDGQFLASGGPDKTARIWNLAAGVELHAISDIPGWVYDVAFARSNRRVLVADYTGTITIIDVSNGEKIASFQLPQVEGRPRAAYHVALSPDGSRLAVACANGNAYIYVLPEEWR